MNLFFGGALKDGVKPDFEVMAIKMSMKKFSRVSEDIHW